MPTAADVFANHIMCIAIIHGEVEPDRICYDAGRLAHRSGAGFHECPYSQETYQALSWRIGWNDRALENTSDYFPGSHT